MGGRESLTTKVATMNAKQIVLALAVTSPTAVAKGDLGKKITVDAKGEILELKNTINVMVDQLNSFAAEVTRVAREVGTEGKLGGQADVRGASGTWENLTDNVNWLATNLTQPGAGDRRGGHGGDQGRLSTEAGCGPGFHAPARDHPRARRTRAQGVPLRITR